jgi:CRP-like cAMP-binding protein
MKEVLKPEKRLKTHIESIIGQKLNPALWVKINALFKTKTFKKGDYFAKEGVKPKHVAFIQKGVFVMYTVNLKGKEFVKRFASENSFLAPYVSIVSKKINKVNIRALIDGELLVADFEKIEELALQYIQIERLLRKIAEFFFIERSEGEMQLALYDAEYRYKFFLEQNKSLQFVIPLYLIASFLSITPTQLSRIRAKKRA